MYLSCGHGHIFNDGTQVTSILLSLADDMRMTEGSAYANVFEAITMHEYFLPSMLADLVLLQGPPGLAFK